VEAGITHGLVMRAAMNGHFGKDVSGFPMMNVQ